MAVQIAPPVKKKRIMYEEYRALPEDGNRHEVVGGELLMTAAPRVKHQRLIRRLLVILDKHVTSNNLGEVFDAPIEVYLGDADFVQPDLVFVSKEQEQIVTEMNVAGAPDLVVEILSPSTARADRVLKANTYARHGISHYWIVDPDAHTLEAFQLEGETYRLIAAHAEDETFEPNLFPGLKIALAELWK